MGAHESDENTADISSLYGDKEVSPSAVGIEARFRQLEYDEAKTASNFRKWLFYWGIIMASFCIALSAMWMALSILFKGSDVLGSTFIGSLAVEVIGIIAIIAKYLFPEHGLPRSRPTAKSATDSKI